MAGFEVHVVGAEDRHVLANAGNIVRHGGGHLNIEEHVADLIKEPSRTEGRTESVDKRRPGGRVLEEMAVPPESRIAFQENDCMQGTLIFSDASTNKEAYYCRKPDLAEESVADACIRFRLGEPEVGGGSIDGARVVVRDRGGGVASGHGEG